MVKPGQFTTKCNGERVIALNGKRQISLCMYVCMYLCMCM